MTTRPDLLPPLYVELVSFEPHERGKRRGSVTVYLPAVGLTISNMALFQTVDGEDFVLMPYTVSRNADGSIRRRADGHANIEPALIIEDLGRWKTFQRAVIDLLRARYPEVFMWSPRRELPTFTAEAAA